MKNISVNTQASSASNFVQAEGFAELMDGLKNKYNTGAEFSIKDVLGQENLDKIKERGGNLVQLGKLLKNNIDNGNLKGIVALDKLSGNVQMYRKTGEIKMKRYFSTQWISKMEHSEKMEEYFTVEKGEIYVFCSFENKTNVEGIKLKVSIVGENIEKRKYELNKKLGDCGFVTIDVDNKEFPSIQAVWYGLDRVYEILQHCNEKISKIYVFGSNDQMMRRISGCYFGEANNTYDFTSYIQDNFRIFMDGEMKGLSQDILMTSVDKPILDKYIDIH